MISGYDILDIRVLDSVETWLFPAIFQVFFPLRPLFTNIWLIFRFIQQILFLIFCWYVTFNLNLVSFPLISVSYTSDIRCTQISSKVLYPLQQAIRRFNSTMRLLCPFWDSNSGHWSTFTRWTFIKSWKVPLRCLRLFFDNFILSLFVISFRMSPNTEHLDDRLGIRFYS